jgi:integrase
VPFCRTAIQWPSAVVSGPSPRCLSRPSGESLSRDVPPHQNTIGYRWRSTLQRAGVTDVRMHDLRHFYASGLIASGCDVVAVQRALGHAKPTTTLTTYAHLWPTTEDRVRDAAARLVAEVVASGEGTVRAEQA